MSRLVEDPLKHFESKDQLIRKEVGDDAMLVALSFRDEKLNKAGVYFASKVKFPFKKIRMAGYPTYDRLCICGVGTYNEFETMFNDMEQWLADFDNLYGAENLSLGGFLKNISRYLGDSYQQEAKALGIELLVMILNPRLEGYFAGFRLKGSGDYHRVDKFAVIGGYSRRAEGEDSIRSRVRSRLKEVYAGGMPGFETAKALAREFLDTDPVQGEYTESHFFFPLKKNGKAEELPGAAKPAGKKKSGRKKKS